MKNKKATTSAALVTAAVAGVVLSGGTAFAATTQPQNPPQGRPGIMGRGHRGAGVFGTLSAINGTTLTVAGMQSPNATAAGTTYTVDASKAIVMKNQATSTLSALAVGDKVMIAGTVNGSSVTATTIRDGMPTGPSGMMKGGQGQGPRASIIQGNGQPIVGGTVTAVTGSTLTITNKSNVTYSVDATSAKVEKGNATSSVSAIAIGDAILAQGAVNGTSVTAASIIDQGAPRVPTVGSSSATPSTPGTQPGFLGGFFGAMGGVFHKLFGFF